MGHCWTGKVPVPRTCILQRRGHLRPRFRSYKLEELRFTSKLERGILGERRANRPSDLPLRGHWQQAWQGGRSQGVILQRETVVQWEWRVLLLRDIGPRGQLGGRCLSWDGEISAQERDQCKNIEISWRCRREKTSLGNKVLRKEVQVLLNDLSIMHIDPSV